MSPDPLYGLVEHLEPHGWDVVDAGRVSRQCKAHPGTVTRAELDDEPRLADIALKSPA